MEKSLRGSDVLLEAWKTRPGISEELFQGIVEATRDLDLHDVLVKGQPKPDFLRVAAMTDDPDRCGNTVSTILALIRKLGGTGGPVIRVFPRGIPWPEQFIVDVTVGGSGPAGQ